MHTYKLAFSPPSQLLYFIGISVAANAFTLVMYAVTTYNLMCGIWRQPRGDARMIRESKLKKKLVH